MQTARIYQRPKNAMQSGRARTEGWILEFESSRQQEPDPLTGWNGGGDTSNQIRIGFPTLEAAKAHAEREGYAYHIVPAPERKLKLQAYADNFR
ncbi:ETC complex I subunit [Sphingomonas sp. M1-B02]|uniref:ETC complex I subunit n=1 Tax=Sphingomonas sp. M1-B02 TaxID=3114300 RepID=UPI00223F568B|nr:ETC complex I subunit [Sphingomonas sp. S6-11]UZK65145.1 ETC complex I subunit [Sphingomonas sp. S6-11]